MGKASKDITTRNESKLEYHNDEDLKETKIELNSNQQKVDEEENEFYVKKENPIKS